MTEKLNCWIMEERDIKQKDRYHYIPKEQFLTSLKNASDDLVRETNEKQLEYMVETTDGDPRQRLKGVPIMVKILDDKYIQITAHKSFTFNATEYGWSIAGYYKEAKRFYINLGGEFALYVANKE
jgi:hypothetical protein